MCTVRVGNDVDACSVITGKTTCRGKKQSIRMLSEAIDERSSDWAIQSVGMQHAVQRTNS